LPNVDYGLFGWSESMHAWLGCRSCMPATWASFKLAGRCHDRGKASTTRPKPNHCGRCYCTNGTLVVLSDGPAVAIRYPIRGVFTCNDNISLLFSSRRTYILAGFSRTPPLLFSLQMDQPLLANLHIDPTTSNHESTICIHIKKEDV
jgi:hypothetical protein